MYSLSVYKYDFILFIHWKWICYFIFITVFFRIYTLRTSCLLIWEFCNLTLGITTPCKWHEWNEYKSSDVCVCQQIRHYSQEQTNVWKKKGKIYKKSMNQTVLFHYLRIFLLIGKINQLKFLFTWPMGYCLFTSSHTETVSEAEQ